MPTTDEEGEKPADGPIGNFVPLLEWDGPFALGFLPPVTVYAVALLYRDQNNNILSVSYQIPLQGQNPITPAAAATMAENYFNAHYNAQLNGPRTNWTLYQVVQSSIFGTEVS